MGIIYFFNIKVRFENRETKELLHMSVIVVLFVGTITKVVIVDLSIFIVYSSVNREHDAMPSC